jgi:hypothetical protein
VTSSASKAPRRSQKRASSARLMMPASRGREGGPSSRARLAAERQGRHVGAELDREDLQRGEREWDRGAGERVEIGTREDLGIASTNMYVMNLRMLS